MNDFFAGAMSGIAQTVVGYPFDTLKIRMQNSLSIKHMKPTHYFRGIAYPLGFASIINAIGFSTYESLYTQSNSHILAGAIAGCVVSPILHFHDIGKIQRQIGNSLTLRSFLTTRGIWMTLTLNPIAFAMYYSTYHACREKNVSILVSGGAAGLINWTLTYPLDVVRSRMYAQRISAHKAFLQKHLWKGYSFCAIRAVLVNSVGFWVYEKLRLRSR
jgi:solute carrier family 25 carnitine/acylcarnitine transporter 20/29